MKLAQEIIIKQLTSHFAYSFAQQVSGTLSVGRPVFYQPNTNFEGRTVILSPETLSALHPNDTNCRGALLVCTAPCYVFEKQTACSILIPEDEVSSCVLLNTLQSIFELFETWEDRLKTICYEEGSFQALVDCTVPVVFNPFCVVDKDFHHVAYCENSVKEGLVDAFVTSENSITPEVFDDIITKPEFSSYYSLVEPFTHTVALTDTVVQNIFYHGEYRGRLIIHAPQHEPVLTRYYFAVFRILSPYANRLYARFKSFNQDAEFFNSLRRLASDILNEEDVPELAWKNALAESAWAATDEFQLVQLRPNQRYDKNPYSKYTGTEIEKKWSGCISLEFRGTLLLLVDQTQFSSGSGEDFFQALAYFLRDNLLTAGISRSFVDARTLPQAFRQTETAFLFGAKHAPMFWYYRFDDYALDYLLSCCTSQYAPEQVCSNALLVLQQHDSAKGTEYYQTLEAYFNHAFNAVEAAKSLFIHRSTFINRMERIKELSAIRFDSTDELLYLSLSFRLLSKK